MSCAVYDCVYLDFACVVYFMNACVWILRALRT